MKTCEKCGAVNDDNALFCTDCGALLPKAEANEAVTDVITEAITEPEEDIVEAEDAVVIEAEAAEEIQEKIVDPFTDPVPEPEYIRPEPISVPVPVPEPTPDPSPEQTKTDTLQTPKKGEHTVKGRAFGIIAFILNLDALLSCLAPGANFGALIYSIIGLIFCHISKNNTNFRLTKVAKIFGILALIFSIVTIVVYSLLGYLAFEALAHDPQVQDFIGRFFY